MAKNEIYSRFRADFSGDAVQIDWLKKMFNAIAYNDVGGPDNSQTAYSLSLAEAGVSGYSMGWVQFDFYQQRNNTQLKAIVYNALNRMYDNKVITASQRDSLYEALFAFHYANNGNSVYIPEDLQKYYDTVQRFKKQINTSFLNDTVLKTEVDSLTVDKIYAYDQMISSVINGTGSTGDYLAKDDAIKQYINNSDLAKLLIIDYNNQYSYDAQGSFDRFLAGQQVNGVKIDTDSEGNYSFGLDDMLRYYLSTQYSAIHPEDSMRRFSNLIEGLGIDNIETSQEEALFFQNELKTILGDNYSSILADSDNTGLQDIVSKESLLDILTGTTGSDILSNAAAAETGTVTLDGGQGNDIYQYYTGHGDIIIKDYDTVTGNSDKLILPFDPDNIELKRNGADLEFYSDANKLVTIKSYFDSDGSSRIENIEFQDMNGNVQADWTEITVRCKLGDFSDINLQRLNNDLIVAVEGILGFQTIADYFRTPEVNNDQTGDVEVVDGVVWNKEEVNQQVNQQVISLDIQDPAGADSLVMAQSGNDLVITGQSLTSPVVVKNYYKNTTGTPAIKINNQVVQSTTVNQKVESTNANVGKLAFDESLNFKDKLFDAMLDGGKYVDENIGGIKNPHYDFYKKVLTSNENPINVCKVLDVGINTVQAVSDDSAFKRLMANFGIGSAFLSPLPALGVNIVTTAFCWYYDSLSEEEKNLWDNNANILLYLSPLELIHDLFEDAEHISPPRIDPLVLDLDGDGIETTHVANGTYFDIDNNGFTERTAWLAGDDGFLVLDRNGDGVINNGSELFGDRTLLEDGTIAANGFQALADFDDNNDGKIDVNDAIFGDLRIWKDRGGGSSDSSELFTLEQLDIKSLGLNYADKNQQLDVNGNTDVGTASYERTDGTTAGLDEILFQRNTMDTTLEHIEVPDDIKALPDIEGSGNVYSLQEAMAADTTGRLKALVIGFSYEKSPVERRKLVNEILSLWTGSTDVDTTSRGSSFDARKLAIMEKFFGTDYAGVGGSNPNTNAAVVLETAYSGLVATIYSRLMAQTYLKEICSAIIFKWDDSLNDFTTDLTKVEGVIESALASDESEGKSLLSEYVSMMRTLNFEEETGLEQLSASFSAKGEEYAWIMDSSGVKGMEGTKWNDNLTGTDIDNAIAGGEGDDILNGNGGNDILYGQDGYDTLYGGDGDDKLDGGSGNDKIYGGNGNDTLLGQTGRDYLEGGAGNDVYVFGRGDEQDTIYDYDYNSGNIDSILMSAGVLPADIQAYRNGNNLELLIKGTEDKLTVNNYFDSSNYFLIEKIEFTDGTVWDAAYIKDAVRYRQGSESADNIQGFENDDVIDGLGGNDNIYGRYGNDTLDGGSENDALYGENGNDHLIGGSGDDRLYGGDEDDVLDGGSGVDYLEGNSGNDTYIFGRGYGSDTIVDDDSTPGNIDRLTLAAGILPEDIAFQRINDNLRISIIGTADEILITNYFYYENNKGYRYRIEKIEFADGTIWNADFIKQEVIKATEENDNLKGYEDDDLLAGLDGDDVIYGLAGNDVIDGGIGNDTLSGGDGNDLLTGEFGNDTLNGEQGDDTLDAGSGNDRLDGGAGNDTYVFGRGYGQDVIREYDSTLGNIDRIVMAADITPADVILKRNSSSLELSIHGTADKITVSDYFNSDSSKVEKIEFADGTVWDIAYIKIAASKSTSLDDNIQGYESSDILFGQEGNDTIYGYAGNDVADGGPGNDNLYGGDGNNILTGGFGDDRLYGEQGEDTLDGGAGNDKLEGSSGNDTYVFGRGYGQDVISDYDNSGNLDQIVMSADITPADIIATRNNNDLELSIQSTADKIKVSNYFAGDQYLIEKIMFADGTVWDPAFIRETVLNSTGYDDVLQGYDTNDILSGAGGNDTLYGRDGNDSLSGGDGSDLLYGEAGEDTLDGGAGNDQLEGANGNDTYIFSRGYGADMVIDYDYTAGNIDKIVMAADILPADIRVKRNGNNLELNINGTTDMITVRDYFSSDYYKVEKIEFTDGTVWDSAFIKELVIKGTEADDQLTGYETDDTINGYAGNDTINSYAGNDVIDSGAGNDAVHGGDGNDTITGGIGDDTLYGENGSDNLVGGDGKDSLDGGSGEDILDPGAGNDQAEGSYGNDTYKFGRGYGQDTINDYDYTAGNIDKIIMAEGILPADIIIRSSGSSLELSINGTEDKITVNSYFSNDSYKIEKIEFADGTVWDTSYIAAKAAELTQPGETLNGSAADETLAPAAPDGNDTIYGFEGNDTINAGAGNDILYGGAGNDILNAGAGDDRLYGEQGDDILDPGAGNDQAEGSYGNDTYKFGRGYDQDVFYDYDSAVGNIDKILMAAGIDPSNIRAARNGSNLELFINGTADKVTVREYFNNDNYKVEKIEFANGTIWDIAAIKKAVLINTENDDILYGYETDDTLAGAGGNDTLWGGNGKDTLTGGDGADSLYGEAGEDSLDGGAGNDQLEGFYGNDTYIFGRGYGQDVFYDYDSAAGNIDKILMAADIAPSDIEIKRDGNNLVLAVIGTADKITVREYFYNDNYKVETIEFANGTVWNAAYIKQSTTTGTPADDYLKGYETDDMLTGLAGNDTIDSYAGNDVIDGGEGNDTLYAGDGNDSLTGGNGDDCLHGETGADTLNGGAGNDRLDGSYGNDTYLFGRGYGQDVIDDYDSASGNIDKITMAVGILPAEIRVKRNSNDLELIILDTDDKLTVANYFYNDNYKIEKIEFAEGTVWDTDWVNKMAVQGTEEDDQLTGYASDDNLAGHGGNDTIHGNDGNDMADGGAGNDTLYGGDGNDNLIGVTGNDIIYGENGNDSLTGGNEDDNLYGGSEDDILDGGAGNDYLEGSTGNDIYVFGSGYGQDVIYDYQNTTDNIDRIIMREDILPADISVIRNGNDLELFCNGSGDKVTVNAYFTNDYCKIEKIEFKDGTVWDAASIKAMVIRGTEADDLLLGYESDDNISASGGSDTINGYAGNDVMDGGAGNDGLLGGEGNDTLTGGPGDDSLAGESGNDTLKGGKGNDNLYGNADSDILDGGSGNDYLEGSTGNDIYIFNKGYGQDAISDSDSAAGNIDRIVMGDRVLPTDIRAVRNGSSLELYINGTNDKLTVDNYFSSGDQYKIERIEFADGTVWDASYVNSIVPYLDGTDYSDVLQGANDVNLIRGLGGNDQLTGNSGADTIDGGEGADSLNGQDGNDILRGGEGADSLDGSSGDDTLDGGAGNDSLEGGGGSDIYIFGKGYGEDSFTDYDSTKSDVDKIALAQGVLPEEVQLRRNSNNLELSIKGSNDKITINEYFNSSEYYKIEAIEFANGTVWDNAYIAEAIRYIKGNVQDETLNGFDGNDVITGEAGYDTIYGYDGNDSLDGGTGDDQITGGNGDDSLTGGEGYDILRGEAGADTLDGGAGIDRLEGGAGDDTYMFGRAYGQDSIFDYDNDAANTDIVKINGDLLPEDIMVNRIGSTLELIIKDSSDKLSINNYFDSSIYRVEKVQFTDGTEWDETSLKDKARFLTGTDLNDTIRGYYDYSQDNVINGLGGDDTLSGRDGSDTLNGGEGNDQLYGESGSDLIQGQAGNDYIDGGEADDHLLGGDGDDKIYGGNGSDQIDGGAGIDYLEGGAGNDVYVFGNGYDQDTVFEYDSSSTDLDSIQFLDPVKPADVKIVRTNDNALELIITGSGESVLIKDYFSNYSIEQVTFSDGTIWDQTFITDNIAYLRGSQDNDYINNGSSSDLIYALDGDDNVYGNDGDDTLDGGSGKDLINGGNGNDKLAGGDGEDSLYGAAGDDTLDGGIGNDYLEGGAGNDTYLLTLGGGQDTVNNYDDPTGNVDKVLLGQGILPENIVLGRQGENLEIGIAGSNDKLIVNGYFGSNSERYQIEKFEFSDGTVWEQDDIRSQKFYFGGTETDDIVSYFSNTANLMYGYGGNDNFIGGSGNDLIDGGSGLDTLNGGGGNDIINGGLGNDYMNGGDGADQLDGGAGDDFINGGTGNDIYFFNLGYGNDTISDYDYTNGNMDTVIFGEGILAEDIVLTRNANNLELSVAGTADKLSIVNGYFDSSYGYYKVEKFQFADGTVLTADDLAARPIYTYGTQSDDILTCSSDVADTMYGYSGNDTLYGQNGADLIYGGDGIDCLDGGNDNDKLYGEAGSDSLYGGAGGDLLDGGIGDDYLDGGAGADSLQGGEGSNILYGGEGADTLSAGSGDDYLDGGSGDDKYIFTNGFGNDTISDFDYNTGNKDTVCFGENILDIIFKQNNNNLDIVINGTDDVLTISNYYSDPSFKIEEFTAADNMTISYTQIEQLIQAMASFSQQNGIPWSQAIQDKPQDVQNLLAQYWVKQAV
ncbi:MAG: calcium-binding protein [Syntrophomonas sp.]